jgi:chemotaxis methyl-accepting protein methylase
MERATTQQATAADYGFLRQLVFGLSQNVLDPSRDYLFETRLTKLLRNQGMSRVNELVQHLRTRKDAALERAIAEAMTINETSFFRDTRPFELLRTELLPKLIEARRMQRGLRFWSAACSSGQEGYSLAMLMLEHFPMLVNWNILIEGTDLNSEVVEHARALSAHLDQSRTAGTLHRALLRPRRRALGDQGRSSQALQLSPGQSVRAAVALQPLHGPVRLDFSAQCDALLFA